MRLTIISLGAGVQSTTMALMAARGEITPMPDGAIFADTQWEPQSVYDHLDWLEGELPYPVYRVSAGDLRADVLDDRNIGGAGLNGFTPIPAFSASGIATRQCTSQYKIIPIVRQARVLLGLSPGERVKRDMSVEQWMGISIDEAHRMRDSRLAYITHRYPLIERGMSRGDCIVWQETHYPGRAFPRSACIGCPYHSDAEWARMSKSDFADACEVDDALRADGPRLRPREGDDGHLYLHRSLIPLRDVQLRPREQGYSLGLFGEECEGMCGV